MQCRRALSSHHHLLATTSSLPIRGARIALARSAPGPRPSRSPRPLAPSAFTGLCPRTMLCGAGQTASSSAAPPRPPPGYRALRITPSDALLSLTVSNKCGQAFRWYRAEVWEPSLGEQSAGISLVKKEEEEGISEAAGKGGGGWEKHVEWSMCLPDRVLLLRQDLEREHVYFRSLSPHPPGNEQESVAFEESSARWLHDYFNMEVPLPSLYEEWTQKDKVFARFGKRFEGIRMLRQDPWECLCAFICSSNNNIARIGQMVQKLATSFSPPLLTHHYPAPPPEVMAAEGVGEAEQTIVYHPFPSPQALAGEGVEQRLRDMGFGYRARYIAETAQLLCREHVGKSLEVAAKGEGSSRKRRKTSGAAELEAEATQQDGQRRPDEHTPESFLMTLRDRTYEEARAELLRFSGVGPKVADCILLMSMDQPSSIPVDRHVFQFAEKWYGLRVKVTSKGYEELATRFRNLWGEYAGWAHSVLFTADLRAFADYQGVVKKEEKAEPELAQVKMEDARADLVAHSLPVARIKEELIDGGSGLGAVTPQEKEVMLGVNPEPEDELLEAEAAMQNPPGSTERSTKVSAAPARAPGIDRRFAPTRRGSDRSLLRDGAANGKSKADSPLSEASRASEDADAGPLALADRVKRRKRRA